MSSSADIILHPGKEYALESRYWQGVPSIEITGKRIWLCWFTGGKFEPSQKNQGVVCYSDNDGKTWNDPYMAIAFPEGCGTRVLDPQFWYAPDGKLWIFWDQDEYDASVPDTDFDTDFSKLEKLFFKNGTLWAIYTENPEAEEPVWCEPFLFGGQGTIRNKPTVLSDGRVVLPDYDNRVNDQNDPQYQYMVASDITLREVKTVKGPKRLGKKNFDEPMIVEMKDGSIAYYARTLTGHIAKAVSRDGMETWEDTVETELANPCTRFYIGRLKNGMLLLINTPNEQIGNRRGMWAFLSEDDGKTWPYRMELDDRFNTTYPDVAEDADGTIYCAYDCQRDNRSICCPDKEHAAKEIVLAVFTPEDVMAGKAVSGKCRLREVASKCLYEGRKIGWDRT